MLAIEVHLLTGRYAATEYNDRSRAEWPPHPARFFSALVAALHDRDPIDPVERDALLWLERQPAPALDVDIDIDEQVGLREVHDVFVPVNDVTVLREQWDVNEALGAAMARLAAAQAESDPKLSAKVVKSLRAAVDVAKEKLAHMITPAEGPPKKEHLAAAMALMP